MLGKFLLFNKFSMQRQISLLFAFAIIGTFILLNVATGFTLRMVLENSFADKADYSLKKIVNDVDKNLVTISKLIDVIALEQRVNDFMSLPEEQKTGTQNYEDIKYITRICEDFVNYNGYFTSFTAIGENGVFFRYGNAVDSAISEFENHNYNTINENEDVGRIRFMGGVKLSTKEYGLDRYVFLISKKVIINNMHCIFMVGLEENMITDILNQNYMEKDERIFILDKESNYVFYSKKGNYDSLLNSEEFMSNLYEKENTSFSIDFQGQKLQIFSAQSSLTRYIFVYAFPVQAIAKDFNTLQRLNLIFAVLILLIVIFISRFAIKNMLRPLISFSGKISAIENNVMAFEKNRHINLNELTYIEEIYDNMLNRIKELMQQVEKNEKEKNDIEIRILQEQINPHFLYNTLEAIHMVCEINNDDDAATMTFLLGRLLRYGLQIGNKGLIDLKSETNHVSNYIELMRFRFKNSIDFECRIDESLYNILIPKMSIQPIVENSIYHGGIGKIPNGRIVIYAEEQGENVIVKISDNGKGFDVSKLQNIDTKKGIGIFNINRRLELYFGMKYGIKIESQLGIGTTTFLTLPKLQGGEKA